MRLTNALTNRQIDLRITGYSKVRGFDEVNTTRQRHVFLRSILSYRLTSAQFFNSVYVHAEIDRG